MVHKKKILLVILDGFGVSDNPSYNATLSAKMPNFNYYKKNYAYTTIEASGIFVGLPDGQFGNSE
jgi:2,3-bisphosphoglycerate-independent phosphoglycerate mutase